MEIKKYFFDSTIIFLLKNRQIMTRYSLTPKTVFQGLTKYLFYVVPWGKTIIGSKKGQIASIFARKLLLWSKNVFYDHF